MGPVVATRSTRWWRPPAPGTSWPPHDRPSVRPRSETPLRGRSGLLGEEGRRFFQDVALLLERANASAQTDELIAFLGGKTVGATALVEVGLLHPDPKRLDAHSKIAGHRGGVVAFLLYQPDRLSSELRRVRRSRSPSHVDSLLGKFSKLAGVHESGSSPILAAHYSTALGLAA